MKNKHILPDSCVQILNAVKRRARNQTFLTNLLLFLCMLLVLPLTEFILDYNLDLPPAVRAVLIVCVFALVLRDIYIRLFKPLRQRPDQQHLARLIENNNPQLKGLLLTAVQLSDPDNPAASHVSPELIENVKNEAANAVDEADLTRIFSMRKLYGSTSGLFGLCLAWVMVVFLKGDVLDVWGARLLLRDYPWPRQVELVIEKPEGSKIMLAEGDDLMIEIRLLRGEVRRVDLVCDWEGGTSTQKVMTRWGGNMFRHTLPNLTKSFSFYARGGDGRTARISVELSERPRIERIEAVASYPEYTGMDDEKSMDGSIRALIGSKVSYKAWIYPKIVNAEMQLFASGEKDPVEKMKPDVEEYKAYDETRMFSLVTGGFEVKRSGYYTFSFEGVNGFSNVEASRFRIKAMPDQVPRIRITAPPSKEECTRNARVAITGEITDDWSVEKSELKYRVRFDPEKEQNPGKEQSLEVPLDEKGKRVGVDYLFELSKIRLKEGSTVLWNLEAEDLAGGKGHSTEHVLVIVRPEDLNKILFDRLNMVREDIRSLKELQSRSCKRTRDLIRKTQDMATMDSGSAGGLGQVRSDERILSNRLTRAADRLYRIQERMVRNSVGDLKDRRWIKSLGDEVRNLVEERVEPLVVKTKSLIEKVGSGNASPATLPGILVQQNEIEEQLQDLEDRMAQFGDVNLIIRRLKDIISNEEEVKTLTKELFEKK